MALLRLIRDFARFRRGRGEDRALERLEQWQIAVAAKKPGQDLLQSPVCRSSARSARDKLGRYGTRRPILGDLRELRHGLPHLGQVVILLEGTDDKEAHERMEGLFGSGEMLEGPVTTKLCKTAMASTEYSFVQSLWSTSPQIRPFPALR